MNLMQLISEIPLAEALGWTVLHSLWQGALIAAVLAISLQLISKDKAELRYSFSTLALVLLLLWTGHTFWQRISSPFPESFDSPALETWTESEASPPFLLSHEENPQGQLAYWSQLLDTHIHWVFGIWLLGVSLFSVRWVGSMIYLQRLRRRHAFPVSGPLDTQVAALAHRLGVAQSVTLLESVRIQTPLVIGYLKPAILIPAGMLSGLAPEQLEAIFAHELAHIQRHDYLINLLQSLVEVLFFYHPAYWWIAAQVRDEREHCCDDIALSVCGNALTYARALAELEGRRMQATNLSVGLIGRKKHLLDRIRRLVSPATQKSSSSGVVFSLLLLIAGLLSLAWLSPADTYLSTVDRQGFDETGASMFLEREAVEQGFAQMLDTSYPGQDTVQMLEDLLAESERQLAYLDAAAFGGFEWTIAGVDTPPPPLAEMPAAPPMPTFPDMPPFPEMPAFPGSLTDSAALQAWQEQVKEYQQNYQQQRQQWQEQQQQWRQQYQEQLRGQMDRYREQMEQFRLQAREVEGLARVQALETQRQAMEAERQFQLARTHQEINRLDSRFRDLPEAERRQEIAARLKREQEILRANEHRLQEEARRMKEDSRRVAEAHQRAMEARMQQEEGRLRLQEEQMRREHEALRRSMEAQARAGSLAPRLANRQGHHTDLYAFSFRVRREMEVDGLAKSGTQIHITQPGAGRYKVNGKKIPVSLREKYEKLLAPYDALIQDQGTVTLDARKGLMPAY